MSSTYRIICLSHDPAITFGDWNRPEPALDAIRDRGEGPAQAHPNCDLIVGRYSYPLIEVICPAGRRHPRSWHPHTDEVIDADWLRLLALSTPETVERARMSGSCWTRNLAIGLRRELDLEESA